jgi:hypothetical protein
MNVFIIGSAIDTAKVLDPKRLNKQIVECRQIINAIKGNNKGWKNHPAVIQYQEYEDWLFGYLMCLENYYWAVYKKDVPELTRPDLMEHAIKWSKLASELCPSFHTEEFFTQMKRRLYTKDNNHYKQWSALSESQENWYWSTKENRFIKYINGKKLK